jgi:hypothetical protein
MDERPTPIVGFRCWVLELGKPVLKSMAMRFEWPAGEIAEATCMYSPHDPPRHRAPDDGCRCGLHARTTPEGCGEEYPYYPVHGYWAYRSAPTSGLMAMGAVLMWGVTLRGKRVIRAQYARVLCLTEKPDLWAPRSGSNDPSRVSSENVARRHQTLEEICAAYAVPMVPFASVARYASEFGDLTERGDELAA